MLKRRQLVKTNIRLTSPPPLDRIFCMRRYSRTDIQTDNTHKQLLWHGSSRGGGAPVSGVLRALHHPPLPLTHSLTSLAASSMTGLFSKTRNEQEPDKQTNTWGTTRIKQTWKKFVCLRDQLPYFSRISVQFQSQNYQF